MMRWLVVVAVVCGSTVAVGCKSKAKSKSSPSLKPGPDTYVYVSNRAALYTRPEASAPKFRIQGLSSPWSAAVFRLAGKTGDWLKLETVASDDGGDTPMLAKKGTPGEPEPPQFCVAPLVGFGALRLHVFVRARDLADVVTRSFTKHFDDGTAFTLAVGTPVGPSIRAKGDSALRKIGGPFRLSQYVPNDALGKAFAGAKSGDMKPDDTPFAGGPGYLNPGTAVRVGGISFELRSRFPEQNVSAPTVAVHGAKALVAVSSKCMHVVAAANAAARKKDRTRGRLEPRHTDAMDGASVNAGARVYWPDGTPAGIVRSWTPVGTKVKSVGNKDCFRREPNHLRGTIAQPNVTLCFDRAAVSN